MPKPSSGSVMHPDYERISAERLEAKPTGMDQWDQTGVLVLKSFLPHDLIDAYVSERRKLLGSTDKWRPGWRAPTPYLHVSSMRELALYRPLTQAMKALLQGQEAGLHLTLTGFQSTERAWHSDSYLNPDTVGNRYIAAWLALGDIDEDAGPFEYVPGSHRWSVIQRSKVWDQMRALGQDPHQPTWPSDSQGWVGDTCEKEIQARGAKSLRFLGKKGDVLLWHSALIHRGSKPNNPALERPALICHYSSIDSRPDMPDLRRTQDGSHYFHFEHELR